MCISMTVMALVGSPARSSAMPNHQSGKIGVQRNGLLELGDGLLMPALEGQNPSELGMCDRLVGAKLNGFSSEAMRAFERGRLQVVFIQRLDPGSQVSL